METIMTVGVHHVLQASYALVILIILMVGLIADALFSLL